MIWRFKSNKKPVGGGIRVIHYKADGSIWLAVGENWSETELIPDVSTPTPVNHPPVAKGGTLTFKVEPKK